MGSSTCVESRRWNIGAFAPYISLGMPGHRISIPMTAINLSLSSSPNDSSSSPSSSCSDPCRESPFICFFAFLSSANPTTTGLRAACVSCSDHQTNVAICAEYRLFKFGFGGDPNNGVRSNESGEGGRTCPVPLGGCGSGIFDGNDACVCARSANLTMSRRQNGYIEGG